MEKVEKINDEALEGISGGTKYNIGDLPVPVLAYPKGPVLYTLRKGDFLVTDGQTIQKDGTLWYHVYTARGEGCIDGWYLG